MVRPPRAGGSSDHPPPRPDQAPMSGALAQVIERLYADFRTYATLRQVIAVVRRCADELDTPSQDAVPELVERLARQRLTDVATTTHAQQPR